MTTPRLPAVVRPAQTKADINVTPLVDVVLVLLIIFMVLTPMLEKDLGVRVPATQQVENPSEVPPDQIVVRIERSGTLLVNGAVTSSEEYVPLLTERLAARAPLDRVVFVTPEDEAAYPKLVEALDGARRAGAETLAMPVVPPPSP